MVPVIIERIKAMGIPTDSFVSAQYFVRDNLIERAAGLKCNFDAYIKELTEQDVETKDVKVAELVFGYLIQESVRFYNMKEYMEIDQAIALAQKKAGEFLAKNPWVNPDVIAEKHAEAVIAAEELGTTAKKPRIARSSGMSKKDRCIALYKQNIANMPDKHQIIELFMKELQLSKPGATTYEYNLRKGIWA